MRQLPATLRLGALVPFAMLLTTLGCAIGPMHHNGAPPPPGEDLVTDVARATQSLRGLVRPAEYEEQLPGSPPAIPQPPPPGAPLRPELATSPCYQEPPGVPLEEPLPGPPPRFFPVPTKPVFSTRHCNAWTTEF